MSDSFTFLIVDDNEVDREMARRCVSPIEGLEILEAENGQQAVFRGQGNNDDG